LLKKVPGDRWVEPLTPAQKALLWKTCKPDQVLPLRLSLAVILDLCDYVIY